jgi:peptide/nickel transport system substrate-binding protein
MMFAGVRGPRVLKRGRGRRWDRRTAGQGALGAAGLLAAGATPALAQTGVVEDELRVITYELFTSLDAADDYSPEYLRSVGLGETLLRVTPRGEVDVDLARGLEWAEPQTLRVDLRPEATFWSGAPVTAGAVLEGLERLRRLVPYAASLLKGVQVEPAGDWTLLFRADAPAPGLPLALASEYLYVHNAGAYPADGKASAGDWRSADLTGFFRVASFEPKTRALLERNERYWGVRPRMARIRIDEVADINTRTLAALSGEAHVVRWISTQGARQVDRSRDMRVEVPPLLGSTNAYLNIQKSPFEDVRVRQALAWALDREELVTLALNGYGTPNPPWLAINPQYPEAKRVGYVRQDLARAGQLLDEAGWRLPAGGRVRTNGPSRLRFRAFWWGGGRPLVEVLQAQWARAGAEVEVQGSGDYGLIETARKSGDWDVFVESWGTFGDPAAELARHVAPDGDLNYNRFRDATIDGLLAGFAGLSDPEARREQALRINERQAELVPFIPLAAVLRPWAVGRRVHNFEPHFLPWAYEVHPDLWLSA